MPVTPNVFRILLLIALTLPCARARAVVTVYGYDSLVGKGSFGAWVADRLEKTKRIKTKFVSFGSAGEALNQVLLEGKSTRADIVIGVDNAMVTRAKASKLFGEAPKVTGLKADLALDGDGIFLPFDYGYPAFVEDTRRPAKLPKDASLTAIGEAKGLAKKIAIEDPRTSSLGFAFLAWTHQTFSGATWKTFWMAFDAQILTISPGWAGAYGLFLKKRADLVLSYSTSPAYHLETEKDDHYRAIIFPEGHYRQVEGAAMLATSANKAEATHWLHFLVSSEAQEKVPLTQWMYPAREGVSLPKSFVGLPEPKAIVVPSDAIEKHRAAWIQEWLATEQK